MLYPYALYRSAWALQMTERTPNTRKRHKKRFCKLPGCKLPFRPRRKDQLFCCKQHCDDYHRRGALPFEKLVDDVLKKVRPPLLERMETIERELVALQTRVSDELASLHLRAMREHG